jgi:hypothetical protein
VIPAGRSILRDAREKDAHREQRIHGLFMINPAK